MNKTILQVPISQDLKINAEREALSQGFSSLQELVRVFLSKIASRKIEVTLQEPITLSTKNEKKYLDMTKDFKSGKNIYSADSVESLINKLHEDPVS